MTNVDKETNPETKSDNFNIDNISTFFNKTLVDLATKYAEELKENNDLAVSIGGQMTLSSKATAKSGPLEGHVLEISISIDPED